MCEYDLLRSKMKPTHRGRCDVDVTDAKQLLN